MTLTLVSGSSFPIGTFCHGHYFYIIHESQITARDIRTGTTIYYFPKRPIAGSGILDDGTLVIFDGCLFAVKILNNEWVEIAGSLLEIPNVREIATKGSQILAVTHSGKLISLKFNGFAFENEYSVQKTTRDQLIIKFGYVDEKTLFFYTTDLDVLELHIAKDQSNQHFEIIDSIEINGLLSMTGSLVIRSEFNFSFICYNLDMIVKLDWDGLTRNFKQTCYKLKTRSGPSKITFIIPGEEYTINDYDCSSMIIFTDSSEILLGILIEDSIKFWTLSHDLEIVNSANYSKELGALFIHSSIMSGIFSIDAKNLKLSSIEIIDCHNTSLDIQPSNVERNQSLLCLSMDKNQLYTLDCGIKARIKFSSDSTFRGVSNIWAIKTHHQDSFHEYLVLSARNYTLAFKYCDSVLTDITNILGISRDEETKCAFNLKNTGYFIQVTARNIYAFDVSKIDTLDNEAMKFKFSNTEPESAWDIVRQHENYLLCFSSLSKTLSVFALRSKSREVELVVRLNSVSLDNFEIKSEISASQLSINDAGYIIYLGTVDGTIFELQFGHEANLISIRSIYLNETAEDMIILASSSSQNLVTSTRCGNLYLCDFSLERFSLIANVSSGPIRISKTSNDSIISYNSNIAAIFSFNGSDFNKKVFSNWSLDAVVELSYGIGKSYLVGISGDSLVFIASPKVSNQALSKHIIAYNSKITSFLPLKSGKIILCCTDGQDPRSFIKYYDSKWAELWSIDHGFEDVSIILSIEENDNFIVVVSKIKDKLQSKFELIEVEPSKLSIKNEYLVDDLVKKSKYQDGILYFSAKEDLFAFKICPITFRFLNRAAYHFRNNIVDFDVFRGMILISTFSDGLDILSISQDFEGNIKLAPSKGDKLSRTCLSCKWLGFSQFITSDTRKSIHLCEINETNRWIHTKRTIKNLELIVRIFLLSLDGLSPMYSSHYHYEAPSFKQKIIQKIVVSVKHYLREGNIENSEAGLVTLLRITGAITENISEVFFSYLRLKSPSNFISTAAYVNNLRPRIDSVKQSALLEYELILCAFHEKNFSAVNQLLLRFQDRASNIYLNMIKYLLASGISTNQGPSHSFKTIFTTSVLSKHRMLAQLAIKAGLSLPDHLSEAIETHLDLQTIKFHDLDHQLMQKYLLLPNFIPELRDYVSKFVQDRFKDKSRKLEFIRYLLYALSFNARNRKQFISSQRHCFNLLLFVYSTQLNSESSYCPNFCEEEDYFRNNRDSLSRSILFLLKQ